MLTMPLLPSSPPLLPHPWVAPVLVEAAVHEDRELHQEGLSVQSLQFGGGAALCGDGEGRHDRVIAPLWG